MAKANYEHQRYLADKRAEELAELEKLDPEAACAVRAKDKYNRCSLIADSVRHLAPDNGRTLACVADFDVDMRLCSYVGGSRNRGSANASN